MKGLDYKDFFRQPVAAAHRRYEALRSVFVDEQPLTEVARQFRISYGTIRNGVSEFCRAQGAGQSPPFLLHRRVGVPRPTTFLTIRSIRQSKLPTFRR